MPHRRTTRATSTRPSSITIRSSKKPPRSYNSKSCRPAKRVAGAYLNANSLRSALNGKHFLPRDSSICSSKPPQYRQWSETGSVDWKYSPAGVDVRHGKKESGTRHGDGRDRQGLDAIWYKALTRTDGLDAGYLWSERGVVENAVPQCGWDGAHGCKGRVGRPTSPEATIVF